MEFSKKAILFTAFIYTTTWLVSLVAWFGRGYFPSEILIHATYLFGAQSGIYGCKACLENREKIRKGGKYNDN